MNAINAEQAQVTAESKAMLEQTTKSLISPVPPGLLKLQEAVPDHLISPLPKGTKAQNQCPDDQKINCKVCGGWHHRAIRHLDYVGHAAATSLLLKADPFWAWEPMGITPAGLPAFDATGGLWIRLTVCGVTRLGYGHAGGGDGKDPGSREKECIGDAIRNAAMRFGLALDLWSKADLHAEGGAGGDDENKAAQALRAAWIKKQKDAIAAAPDDPALAVILDAALKVTDQEDDADAAKQLAQAAKERRAAWPKPGYPDEAFAKNLPAWRKLIEGKSKTAEQIIATVESKGQALSDKQKADIKGVPA